MGIFIKQRDVFVTASSGLVFFHSSAFICEKAKKKWTKNYRREEEPDKPRITFSVREKRSDAKSALKDLLSRNSCSKSSFQLKERSERGTEQTNRSVNNDQSKLFSHHAKTTHYNIRKMRRSLHEDSDSEGEHIYRQSFRKKRSGSSFGYSKGNRFQNTTFGFEWRDQFHSHQSRKSPGDTELEDESTGGSCSHRIILGLPQQGSLKLEDVKNAFHESALKWHPDMHQGPSKSVAEEKFKLCLSAYKSLCQALS